MDIAPSGYTWLEEFLNGVDTTQGTNGITANAGNDVSICEGTSTTLTASGGATYQWNTGATTASIDVNPSSTTTYTVTAFDATGTNSDTDDVIVTVNALPTANAGNDVATCIGTAVTLTASGGDSYLWNTGADTQSIDVNPNTTTTYSVEVTQNGCSDTDDIIVTVNPLPTIDAGSDVTINLGESTTLTASGGDSYVWNTTEDTASIIVSPGVTTTYSVTGFLNGCENNSEVTVTVIDTSVTANAGNDVSICEGTSTTLTASGGATYQWNTGATTASIDVNPSSTTTYTVTAFDATGTNSDTDDVIVTVNALPTANAGNDVATCIGTAVTLTASGGDSYLWNTGADTQSIDVNPNTTTTYSVEVTQNGCSDTDDVIVTVNPLPTIDAGSDVTINLGESTTLTASGGDSYVWNTTEDTASIIVSPGVTTTYSVTGFLNGCENNSEVTVTVIDTSVTANAGNDVSICEGTSTTLTASGGATYQWNTGATTASIDVNPSSTTTFTVTAFDATGTNSDTDDVIVTVNPLPTIDAGSDVTINLGESTTLTASGGDSYVWNTTEDTVSIIVSPGVTTTYSVTGFLNGCENNSEVTVTVIDTSVTANAGNDVSICEGISTTLTASGGATYQWNTGATTASIDVNPSSTTTYTVTAFDATGTNSDTDDVIVTVNALPTANAGNDVATCIGTAVTLTASGGDSYLWNTGADTQSIDVNPNATTTYSVEVTQNGCSDTDDIIVTVNPLPTIDAGSDVTINLGESTTLTASGGDSYVWNTTEDTASIIVSPGVTTTYSVTGFLNGCENNSEVTVTVIDTSVTANAGNDVSICEGTSTTLTASGGATYQWNTGATTASIDVNPSSTTTYTVTAFDATGTNSDTDDVIVTVNALPTANAGNDVATCIGTAVTLTASGGDSYLWNTGADTQSIDVNPNATTTYSVEVTQNGCSDTDDVIVTVNPLPTIDAGSDVTINLGESTTLTASGGDSYVWNTTEDTASIIVSPGVTTTYSVTGFLNGCENNSEVTVTVFDGSITADAGEDVTICQGYETTLTATGGSSYLWSTGETTQSITVNPTATVIYSVIVYDGIYEDEAEVTVSVNPNPEVVILNGDNIIVFANEFTTLSVAGANTYEWNNGATDPNIAVNPSVNTTYSVIGYINGCSDMKEINVNVVEHVIAHAGEDQEICIGESITLTATGGDEYLWDNGETTQSIMVSPEESSEYSVLVYNALDADEATVLVSVTDCSAVELPIEPTRFSFVMYPNPASDIVNIQISGFENLSGLQIYDLAGKLIYTENIETANEIVVTKALNISNFSRGMYILKLAYNDKILTERLILK